MTSKGQLKTMPKIETRVLRDFQKHGIAGKKIGSVYIYNKSKAHNMDLDSTIDLINQATTSYQDSNYNSDVQLPIINEPSSKPLKKKAAV